MLNARLGARVVAFALAAATACLAGAQNPIPASASIAGEYSRLARQGSQTARTTLGLLLLEGETVPANALRARLLLEESAVAGDTEAQVALGDAYANGRALDRDLQRAARWFAQASCSEPYAAWRLGQMFESGEGVRRNEARAARLYSGAASKGFAPAANSLGGLYLAGAGVERNYAEALGWYRKAASAGFADAFLNLAGMYVHGLGVDRDLARAFALAVAAADVGARDAGAFLAEIERVSGQHALAADH